MGNCCQLLNISGRYLPIALIKKVKIWRYTCKNGVAKIQLRSLDVRRLIYSDHIRPLKGKKGLKSWERRSLASSPILQAVRALQNFISYKSILKTRKQYSTVHTALFRVFLHLVQLRQELILKAQPLVQRGYLVFEFSVFLYVQAGAMNATRC
jgi:hypothetical protein